MRKIKPPVLSSEGTEYLRTFQAQNNLFCASKTGADSTPVFPFFGDKSERLAALEGARKRLEQTR